MSVPCSGSGSVKAGGCDEGPGICSVILTLVSVILVIATLPFSLLLVVKVVQVQIKERYPPLPHWARVRNTRGLWYSASGCCWPEAPGAPVCSSSCPVSTCTRRLTWGPRPSTSLHRRFVCVKGTRSTLFIQNPFRFSPRTVSLCLSMQLCIIRSDLGFLRKTLEHHDIQIYTIQVKWKIRKVRNTEDKQTSQFSFIWIPFYFYVLYTV